MPKGVYAYAYVDRGGLGNMLYSWARCEIFSSQHGIAMLSPPWTQPRIGPLLRWERDFRYYTGLFSARSYIRGIKKLRILWAAQRIGEYQPDLQSLLAAANGREKLVVFNGMRDFFQPLLNHRPFVRQRLLEILSDRVRRRLAAQKVDWVIAVHIRRGDMNALPFGQPWLADMGLALEWFIGCVRSIRQAAGADLPVRVFSDGREDELRPLLSLPNVSRAEANPSVIDLLLMSRSPMLVTTCASTFSGWACYLGQPLSFWYPDSVHAVFPQGFPRTVTTDFLGNVSADAQPLIQQAAATPTRDDAAVMPSAT